MSTDKSPADAPQTDRIIGNNPPPTSYPLTVSPSFQWKPNSTYDAVFRGFNNQPTQPTQPSTTPVEIRGNPSNPMQRDQTNFDSSMIKTTGSSSTDESRRIIIEPIQLDGRITPDVSAARHSGLNNDSIGRSSNGNPAMPLSRDDPHNLNPPADKKVFLKRRTSDGFMSSGSGSSPAKDSNGISSPLRNILRVNNGRSSGERAEPSRYFFTNTVHNESMGSPLLRPSPIKTDMNNTGSYASFFMKKITSIDSNISSEMDPLPVSIAPMKYMGTTQQVASPPSPDLARAMTAVVVTSNQAPRQAISSTMTK
jgi:hypothetical protein